MLNIAIRGHDISNIENIQQLATKARELGAQSLQLALGISFPNLKCDLENMNPGLGKYFYRVLDKENIDVAILSCYINMIHPDLEIREKLLKKFESYVKYAKYFGATMVASETGCVYPEIKYTEKNFTEDVFKEAVSVIKRLVKSGEKYNTLVAIEPGLNHPIHSLEKTKRLIEEVNSDYLSIILDPTNLITLENYKTQPEILEEAFNLFGEKINAVHVKDFTIENLKIKPVNLFEGLMQVEKIIDIIEKHKPGNFIVIEQTKDEAIKTAVEKLNLILNK